ERLGTLELWNVAIRPGKPLAFGHIQGTPLLGCPGNPVSLFVSFCLFARPLLLRLQGVSGDLAPPRLRLRAGFEWPRPDKRREFHRARIVRSPEGEPELAVYPSRSSALIGSLTWAEGLVDLAPGRVVRPGDAVDFLSFAELFPS
ncbi:MAG: molybdopterin molybdenumtransferase MoeA, partial [Chromatiaceae bacterium]|nr:molybdopterin molybdenumtransferase MoeA [Chromatiaceae bacterium]